MAFGAHIAARLDLVPEMQIAALRRLETRIPALSVGEFTAAVNARSSGGTGDKLVAVEEKPVRVTAVTQTHRARLRDGRTLRITAVRPDVAETLDKLEFVGRVGERVFPSLPERARAAVVEDFATSLRSAVDLTRFAVCVADLRSRRRGYDVCRVPELAEELCSERVVALEEAAGVSLRAWLSEQESRRIEREELARRVGGCWLRQALSDGLFASGICTDDMRVLPDGTVELHVRHFGRLNEDSRNALLRYLLAEASGESDVACDFLLSQMEDRRTAENREELHRSFRQIVSFRDGLSRDGVDIGELADRIVAQWRTASGLGFVLDRRLGDFLTGLTGASLTCREIAPQCDALDEALREFRLIRGAGDGMHMMAPAQMFEMLDRYAVLMMGLPGRMDELLTAAAKGRPQARDERDAGSAGVGLVRLSSIVLVAAGVGLLVSRFLPADAGDRLRSFLMGILAAAALWMAARPRHGD
jgi:ubiquinone biosynthesis protein